jgi:hypothetical protein
MRRMPGLSFSEVEAWREISKSKFQISKEEERMEEERPATEDRRHVAHW